jgi:hypothetical protein
MFLALDLNGLVKQVGPGLLGRFGGSYLMVASLSSSLEDLQLDKKIAVSWLIQLKWK